MDLSDLEKHEEITEVTFAHKGAHLATTHMLQGGASSGWNTSLILKGAETDQELIKALEQVTVTLSLEEFLRKFFDMYYEDAELLTKILGYQTEEEYRIAELEERFVGPDRMGTEESWEEYQKRNLETRADKVKFIQEVEENGIEHMTTVDKVKLLQFQSEVEKAVFALGGFDAVLEKVKSESENVDAGKDGVLSDEVGVEKSSTSAEGKAIKNPSADKKINKTKVKEKVMTDKSLEKTADQVQLEKMVAKMEELEKALADANKDSVEKAAKLEALEKAESARMVAGAQKLVKSFGFIAEESQEAVVEFMVKSVEAPMIAEILKQAQEAVAAAKADVEKAKEEFGATEVGVVTKDAPVVEKGQGAVDKSLASFAEAVKNLAD